jgi:energy-coupling factor transport system ATP-binding protein
MAEEPPYIRLENVTFEYDRSVSVIDGFSASLAQSSTTLLTGANGAGKTTLLKLLVGLLKPGRGTIVVAGQAAHTIPLHEMAARIAVSLQKAEYQMFLATVQKEIAFGPENLCRPNSDKLVSDTMSLFSLTQYSGFHPYDIHPSRRKLLSLASAVAMDTPFLIFDEPTSGLSKPEKAILSSVLVTLREQGKGYILITHDLAFGVPQCERMMVLGKGKCIADESIASMLERGDAEAIMRKASTRIPTASRLSRLFGHHPVAKTTNEFVSFLKEQTHDH